MKLKNTMIKSLITILFLTSLLLFSGCSEKEDDCVGDECYTDDAKIIDEVVVVPEETPKEVVEPVIILSDDIIAIQEKAKTIKSYEFLDHETGHSIFVKDNKYVIISDSNEFEVDGYKFNTYFMDYTNEVSYAACMNWNKYNANCRFDENMKTYKEIETVFVEKPINPFDELFNLENGEIDGTIGCGDRTCNKIKYTKDGNDYIMLVRTFYPMPFEIKKLDSEGVKLESTRYDYAAFNHLKDEDFEIPEEFELVE